jgi:hypothetical protein
LEACLAYEQADAAALPFDDGTFAVVWKPGIGEPTIRLVDEFARVLAPAGGWPSPSISARPARGRGPRWNWKNGGAGEC